MSVWSVWLIFIQWGGLDTLSSWNPILDTCSVMKILTKSGLTTNDTFKITFQN